MITQKQIEIQAELLGYLRTNSARETFDHLCHTILAEVLKGWQGKKLTARIATQYREALLARTDLSPDKLRVVYQVCAGLVEVLIWGVPHHETYSETLVLFIAHAQTTVPFDLASFEHNDCCHGSAVLEREQKRQQAATSPEFSELVALLEVVENAKARLAELTKSEAVCAALEYQERVYRATCTKSKNS
jgi:hypothetical protein